MLRGVVLVACAAAARAAADLRVTFSASAGNVTVCGAPTAVFEAATIPLAAWQLANGSVAQVGGYYTQNEPNVSWTVDDDEDDDAALFSLFFLDPDAFYCGKCPVMTDDAARCEGKRGAKRKAHAAPPSAASR